MVNSQQGQLIGQVTMAAVIAWTLLPNSHSLMIVWPGVLFWQFTLGLPILWVIWKAWGTPLKAWGLGAGLDEGIALFILSLGLSTFASAFPTTAIWYSFCALSGVAALYGLTHHFKSAPQRLRLFRLQGFVAIAFYLESLVLWWTQIYGPELQRLSQIQQETRLNLSFSFNQLALQNWQPIGHQNYVAGYIVLTLPIVLGLCWGSRGWQRKLWGMGVVLALLDLYTTSSRGGWVAIAMLFVGIIALLFRTYRWQYTASISLLLFSVLGIGIFSNDRLRSFVSNLQQGNLEGSQLTYRWITHVTGWNMGWQNLWTGVGLGHVPLLYQHYRPLWAGREAELHHQLHGTPIQLFAELGLWGLLIPLGFGLLLAYRVYLYLQSVQFWNTVFSPDLNASPRQETVILLSSVGSCLSFTIMGLTDFQLDNLGISGTLILALAFILGVTDSVKSSAFPHAFSFKRWVSATFLDQTYPSFSLGLIGFCLVFTLWAIPLQRSWAVAQSGFTAIAKGEIEPFVAKLSQAHQLDPTNAYYPFQLGWVLGDLSLNPEYEAIAQTLRVDAIQWFETAIDLSPYQEFGTSNLGWLRLQNGQPKEALEAFQRSTQLVPAKPSIFLGLGLSALFSGQGDLAIASFAREILRHPVIITSPIWDNPPLQGLQNAVFNQVEEHCQTIIGSPTENTENLTNYAYQVRAAVRWWRGNLEGAKQDWTAIAHPLGLAIVEATEQTPSVTTVWMDQLQPSPTQLLLQAWQNPTQYSLDRLDPAQFLNLSGEDFQSLKTLLHRSFNEAQQQNLDLITWIKNPQHYRQFRNERLGFGVLIRHLGGPTPLDYGNTIENVLITQFFPTLFPQRSFFPALDRYLNVNLSP